MDGAGGNTPQDEAAARALYSLADDQADSFTRALREAPAECRRRIGPAISSSDLADEAASNLPGESRDKTYDAFSLLFLMAKAGETRRSSAIEMHPENEVRLAVVKLLAFPGNTKSALVPPPRRARLAPDRSALARDGGHPPDQQPAAAPRPDKQSAPEELPTQHRR